MIPTDTVIRTYLQQAYNYATLNSHDNSTHVGSVIVSETPRFTIFGTNGFPSESLLTKENLERERKYPRIEHAERVAIYRAARQGYRLEGATMFCPWACCAECARAIVVSGIKAVYTHKEALDKTTDRWKESIEIATEILDHAGVDYIHWSGEVGDCVNLYDGQIWYP